MNFNKKILENIYYNFIKTRIVEEEIIDRYHQADKMKCPIHFCIGQELIPSVLSQLLLKKDSIFCSYRSHGYFLANKGSLNEMIAEFYGKETGTNGGLAGSQGLFCTKTSFYSGAILGGQFAMAVGDAYSKKFNNSKGISIAVIGDGGMEEGITFEAINLAVVKKLPVLFICENNQYATQSHIKERAATDKVLSRVKGFGIESHLLKTNNITNVFNDLDNIISSIRKNKKPVFIECMTYRFNGHVGPEGDDHYNYRSKKEIKSWKNKDSLKMIEKFVDKNLKIKVLKKVNKEINKAFDFAEKSSFPTNAEKYNFNGTYSKIVKQFTKNKNMLASEQESHIPGPY